VKPETISGWHRKGFRLFRTGKSRRGNPLGIVGTLALMILTPIAAMLVQIAISRTRGYGAGRMGAEICRDPLSFASALEKLDRAARRIDNPAAEANPATAHLFIAIPLHAHAGDKLFSTHPNIQERIQRPREVTGLPPPARRIGPWG
jgi:heat shock protein HtpX